MAIAPITSVPEHDDVLSRVRAAAELIAGIGGDLAGVFTADLAEVAAQMSALSSEVQAAQAAVVLEASARGVIGSSDHPRTSRWVEQACREGGVPVTRRTARDLNEITATCAGPDADLIRDAVTAGRLPLETAGPVAKIYRRLRRDIDHPHWDELARTIIDWAAEGASPTALRQLEDRLLGQYGTAGALDDKHDRLHRLRDMTGFRPDRFGMMTATLRLDPTSEAVLTAALDALCVPAPTRDDRGDVLAADPRTPGQRRADALVTLAGHAAHADPTVPGTGAKARVTVTVTLTDLMGRTPAGSTNRTSTPLNDGVGHACEARGFAAGAVAADGIETAGLGYATTGHGQILTPAAARMLACDAEIIPAVLGSRSDILDLGRATRLITPGQRAALQLRDHGCTYPGCTAPPTWCDGHHIRHWSDHGPTDLRNLALLCRHHHTVVHRRHHTATIDSRGVHWHRADGTPIGNTHRWRPPHLQPPKPAPDQ